MAVILKVLILKKLKNNKPMYTEECILRNPNMQDVRMLSEFGYKSLFKAGALIAAEIDRL